MPDDVDRFEELREKEPSDLQVPGFYADDFTRELIRAQTKLPVLIHGETVYVDDAGIWYARTRAQADRLWRLMGPRNSDLNAFRLLPVHRQNCSAHEIKDLRSA